MLLSVNWDSPYTKTADEVVVPFNQLGLFCSQKRLVITTPGTITDKMAEQLQALPNYTFRANTFSQLREARSKGLNAYLNIPVTDWTFFQYLKSLDVSDIWVDAPLTFQNDLLNELKGDTLIRAHVFSTNPAAQVECSQHLTPQSFPILSSIDILEVPGTHFLAYQNPNPAVPILYFIPRLFDYYPLAAKAPVGTISEDFYQHRANCGQGCMAGKHCRFCESYFRNSESLERLSK